MTLLALIFKSSMYVTKIVKNKNLKKKNCGFFIYSSFSLISTLIFYFHQLHFKNKILSRIANIYGSYWHKLTKKLFKSNWYSLNNRSIAHSCGWRKWKGNLLVIFLGYHKWVTSRTITISPQKLVWNQNASDIPKILI